MPRTHAPLKPLTADEEALLRRSLPQGLPSDSGWGPKQRFIVETMLFTGALAEELSRLVVAFVDFSRSRMLVPEPYLSSRPLPMSREMVNSCLGFIEWKRLNAEPMDGLSPLVRSQKGGPLTAGGWGDAWRAALSEAELPPNRSHRLTAGCRLARSGMDPETLREWLGYRHIYDVFRYYGPPESFDRESGIVASRGAVPIDSVVLSNAYLAELRKLGEVKSMTRKRNAAIHLANGIVPDSMEVFLKALPLNAAGELLSDAALVLSYSAPMDKATKQRWQESRNPAVILVLEELERMGVPAKRGKKRLASPLLALAGEAMSTR